MSHLLSDKAFLHRKQPLTAATSNVNTQPLCWRLVLVFRRSLKRTIEGKESARAFVVVRWMAEQMAEGMILNKPGHCKLLSYCEGAQAVNRELKMCPGSPDAHTFLPQINNKTAINKIDQRRWPEPTWIPGTEASWWLSTATKAEVNLDPVVVLTGTKMNIPNILLDFHAFRVPIALCSLSVCHHNLGGEPREYSHHILAYLSDQTSL